MGNILIVDDSLVSARKLKAILEESGHTIVGEAKNGVEGLAKYKELSPDLVTMDITMPEMNGIECLKKIRELSPRAKVVMITALGSADKMSARFYRADLNGRK